MVDEEEPVHGRAEEHIIRFLKPQEAGMKTADLCRERGMSAATIHGWKAKYGGMDVREAQRLKDKNEVKSMLQPS